MFSMPTLIISFFILVFTLSLFVFVSTFRGRKQLEIKWLLTLTAAICFVTFCSLNVYVQGSLESKVMFSRLRYLGFSIVGQTFFFFLIHTFKKPGIFHKPFVIGLSFIPSLMTAIVVLSPSLSHLMVKDYQLIEWGIFLTLKKRIFLAQ